MKNTWQMGQEKQTKGKFTDLAHCFGKIHRERKGKQERRIEKWIVLNVSRLILTQQKVLLCDAGNVTKCQSILLDRKSVV